MSGVREETRKVYIASDGKEFLDKNSAMLYEEELENTKIYLVRCNPDLTERGTLGKEYYISVRPYHGYGHDLMVEDYMYRKYGSRAAYVQGSLRTLNWDYKRVERKDLKVGTVVIKITEDNIKKV